MPAPFFFRNFHGIGRAYRVPADFLQNRTPTLLFPPSSGRDAVRPARGRASGLAPLPSPHCFDFIVRPLPGTSQAYRAALLFQREPSVPLDVAVPPLTSFVTPRVFLGSAFFFRQDTPSHRHSVPQRGDSFIAPYLLFVLLRYFPPSVLVLFCARPCRVSFTLFFPDFKSQPRAGPLCCLGSSSTVRPPFSFPRVPPTRVRRDSFVPF